LALLIAMDEVQAALGDITAEAPALAYVERSV